MPTITIQAPKDRSVRNFLILITIIWAVYAVLVFMSPTSEAIARYGLTFTQFQVVRISFLLPNLFIWLAAGYALSKFRSYNSHLEGSPEREGFDQIVEGLQLLLLALVIPAFIYQMIAFNPTDPDTISLTTIFRNYITLIIYLAAFGQLYRGARNLNKSIGKGKISDRATMYSYGLILLLGAIFAYWVFQNQFRSDSADPLIHSTYFLSDPLIITTIILPYILAWLWGVLAIINFRKLSRTVDGQVYRKAFSSTASGLIAIITLSILVQFLSQLAGFFGRASISAIMGVIYVLLLIMAVGYTFIARGVRTLASIEEA